VAKRVKLPGQRAIGDPQRHDRVGVGPAARKIAVGRAEDHQPELGQHGAGRPDAATAVVEHAAVEPDVGLELPHRVAGVEAGRDHVAGRMLLAILVHAEEHAAVGDHR
jgi:hypothetical protein